MSFTKRDLLVGKRKVGVGFYSYNFSNVLVAQLVKHEYPNGVVRRVWVDREGRSVMIGWFFDKKRDDA